MVVADSWSATLGQAIERAFRIVVLTQPQAVPAADLADPCLAVYMLGIAPELTAAEGRLLREPGTVYSADRLLSVLEPAIDMAEILANPDDEQRITLIASALLEGAEAGWKAALPWARALEPGMEAEPACDTVPGQQAKLLQKLGHLEAAILDTRRSLRRLRSGLGQPLDSSLLQALDRLQRLCSSRSYIDFHAAVTASYSSVQALAEDVSLCQRLSQLARLTPDILAARSYLEAARVGLSDQELEMDRLSLLEQLNMANLVHGSHLWPSIKALLDWFKARYGSQYQAHHSRYHLRLSELRAAMDSAYPRLQALSRLNSLEALGNPVGQGLGQRYEPLLPQLTSCPAREVSVPEQPRCPNCRLALDAEPPQAEVQSLLAELDSSLRQQQRRLSTEAIRRILSRSTEPRLDRFLKVVRASDLSALTEVLDDELVVFLRDLLAEAGP